MLKTLLATLGAVTLAASTMQAAPGHSFGGSRGSFNSGSRGPAASFSRPAARSSGAGYAARGRFYGNHGGYYHGGHHGYHRYYLYGVPYFYDPFFFGGYYGGFYGSPYGYGYGYNNGAYDGRIVDGRNRDNDDDNNARQNPADFSKAVQRQLARRGYYKGSVDGEFGPASKSALTRFQKDNDLRTTGRIDPATLKALGFEDREHDDD